MTRVDDAVDRPVVEGRARAAARGSSVEIFAAAEGQVVELPERARRLDAAESRSDDTARRLMASGATLGTKTVLIVDDAPDIVSLLIRAPQAEGVRLLSSADGDSALRIARAERPDLILLDWILPERNGLDVCRALRDETDTKLSDVPVVLITANTEPEKIAARFWASATDYLTKPFKVAHVRSRVRGWLLRTSATELPDR
jgi:CheY-like chemotaxis protein